jgi:hypothetical protein
MAGDNMYEAVFNTYEERLSKASVDRTLGRD